MLAFYFVDWTSICQNHPAEICAVICYWPLKFTSADGMFYVAQGREIPIVHRVIKVWWEVVSLYKMFFHLVVLHYRILIACIKFLCVLVVKQGMCKCLSDFHKEKKNKGVINEVAFWSESSDLWPSSFFMHVTNPSRIGIESGWCFALFLFLDNWEKCICKK